MKQRKAGADRGATTGFVSADGAPKPRPLRRVRLALLISALILALGLTTVWLIHRHNARLAEDRAIALQTDKLQYESAITRSNMVRGQRQYAQAIAVIEGYAAKALDTDRKAQSYVQIANIYEVQQDNASALAYYRKAEALSAKPKRGVLEGIARTSRMLGDKQTALKYYKQELALLRTLPDADQPFNQSDMETIEQTIAKLEAGS